VATSRAGGRVSSSQSFGLVIFRVRFPTLPCYPLQLEPRYSLRHLLGAKEFLGNSARRLELDDEPVRRLLTAGRVTTLIHKRCQAAFGHLWATEPTITRVPVVREVEDFGQVATNADCQRGILLLVGAQPKYPASVIVAPRKSRFQALVVLHLPRLAIAVY